MFLFLPDFMHFNADLLNIDAFSYGWKLQEDAQAAPVTPPPKIREPL
jgi:hypothetical protein